MAVPSAPFPGRRGLQVLDDWVGGALVARVRRRATGSPNQILTAPASAPARVLLLRPGGLGDALLLWPLLTALRTAWPRAVFAVLAERRNAGAFALNPLPDRPLQVWCYDTSPCALSGRCSTKTSTW